MKSLFRRVLSMLLVLVMAGSMLPVAYAQETAQPSGEAAVLTDEDYASADAIFAQIDKMEDAPATKNASETELADKAAAIVMASDDYVEGSLERNGNYFTWFTTEGVRCAYSPYMREKYENMKAPENPEPSGIYNEPKATKGGWPSGNQVYLIAPYYGIDDTFTDQYKNEAKSIASAIGDTDGYTLYSGTSCTIDNVATAISNGAVVIFDSHGTTDYDGQYVCDDPDGYEVYDYVSQANYSYLCLTTKTGLTTKDYNAGATYFTDSSGDLCVCVNGAAIANHMTQNSPAGILWMAICLGMATDTFATTMRAKGVEVVYGYSQSVTFAGDYCFEETFWDKMIAGNTVAQSISAMKSKWGEWDWSEAIASEYGYSGTGYTLSEARKYRSAFPIVVSDEDAHPGQRTANDSSYGACSQQTVKSTYTLYNQCNVTATSNNTAYGTVSVDGSTITASPATGYFAQSATVTSGSATVTQNGNIFSVNAQSDCTVQIIFAPKTAVTVSFSGATVASQNGYAGDAMTLPTNVTAPEGYSFLGWTSAPLSEDVTAKPSFYTTSFTPTGNTTLYALYSYVDENTTSGTGDYVKVTETPDDWSGEYLIVYESKGYILDSSLSTLDAKNNYKTVTITDNTISAAAGDPYKFVITAVSGGYAIQTVNGTYISGTADANKLNTGSTAAVNTLNIDASGNAGIVSNTSYLRYNTSDTRFRYYKSSSYSNQAAIALYVKDGAKGTTYYTSNPTKCEHTNTTDVAAVAATCIESGYTAGVYCNDCETYISGHEVVAATGHSWGTWSQTSAPTCTAAGEQVSTCGNCGETQTQSIPATGHSYNGVVTPPTATEQGYTTYTCTVCGNSYVGDYVEALGETFYVSFSVPSGVESIETMACGKNGITLPTADAPEGYSFVGWVTEATEDTESMPTVYTGSYTAKGNITLYALYSYTEGGSGESGYILTDISEIGADDVFVITMECTDGTIYALSNSAVSKNPAAPKVTETNGKLDSEPDSTLLWNLGGSEGAWTFYPDGTTARWLAISNTNAGISVGTGSAKTFSVSGGYLYYSGYNRYVGVYRTNPDWRSYTNTTGNIAGQALGFYVKNQGGTTYYTTISAAEPRVELTHISLVPHKDALGYKAAAYNMPEDAHVQISLWVNEDKVVTKETTALRLVNILTRNGGESTVYAQATMVDAQGEVIAQSAIEQTTMRQAIECVNDNYTDYNAEQLTALKDLILSHEAAQAWNVANILKEEEQENAAMVDIVNAAYDLAIGETMSEPSTLTGVITEIDTPYSSSYNNISVVIAVAGAEDKPILCHRLKGEGADQIGVGDTITVTGTLMNYDNGSTGIIEFGAGCTLDSWEDTAVNETIPTDPVAILTAAYALAAGEKLPYEATLTGTITSIDTAYSTQYQNITVTITVAGADGMPIMCYRLKGTGADALAVGDLITVTGIIKNYNGTIEFDSGCTFTK